MHGTRRIVEIVEQLLEEERLERQALARVAALRGALREELARLLYALKIRQKDVVPLVVIEGGKQGEDIPEPGGE
jgi:DNA-directed RNA polymerase specialized sigma24 family protein